MIRKIARNSACILIPAAAASFLLPWENLPFSILAGGLLGILNIRALAWSVAAIVGGPSVGLKMLFFSQFRFVILTLVIVLLLYLRLVMLSGIMAGFTVVFIQVAFVGLKEAGKASGP